MNFAQIPANASVFIDANVLVYYFAPDPALGPACQQLMSRINHQEIAAWTSAHSLGDAAHRTMVLEAVARFGWPLAGAARRLRQNGAFIQQLSRYRQIIDEVPRLSINVVPVSQHLLRVAGALSQQYGLLSGDGLVLAVMQDEAITNLASHDADFDRVSGIARYAPL
jgi:predicted nucleic acid-binding protein